MFRTAWHCREATNGASQHHPVETTTVQKASHKWSLTPSHCGIQNSPLFDLSNPTQILGNWSLLLSHWSQSRGVSQSGPIKIYRVNHTPRSMGPSRPFMMGPFRNKLTSAPENQVKRICGFCPSSLIKQSSKQCWSSSRISFLLPRLYNGNVSLMMYYTKSLCKAVYSIRLRW